MPEESAQVAPGATDKMNDARHRNRIQDVIMDAWGKYESPDCFHRLEHHCADVAACFLKRFDRHERIHGRKRLHGIERCNVGYKLGRFVHVGRLRGAWHVGKHWHGRAVGGGRAVRAEGLHGAQPVGRSACALWLRARRHG